MIWLSRACRQKYVCTTKNISASTLIVQNGLLRRDSTSSHIKQKKTDRVQIEILRFAMEMSSVSASDYLRNHGIEVSKSVICELVKKNA